MAGLFNPELTGHPTSLAAAVLTDENRTIVIVIAAVALAALLVAQVLTRQVLAAGEGTDSMKKIAAAVQEGANAYLARQLRTLGIFAVVVFFLLMLLPADNWSQRAGRSLFFLVGALSRRPPDTSACDSPYARMCEWPRPRERRPRRRANRKRI